MPAFRADPADLLTHADAASLWPSAPSADPAFDVARAYRRALEVRELRRARGEKPVGYKIGFTNRSIWQRYEVFAPIWGTVYDTTTSFCDGSGRVSLRATCQPRIEPEAVFGLRATPAPEASLQDLVDAIDWIAPGFEIVQSHLADWKFRAADTVADGGLHARLLVGRRQDVRAVARDAGELVRVLGAATVALAKDGEVVDRGRGSLVLDSPLHALRYFLAELRACPGAADLKPGDVVTTGTWTDAWPVKAGERWEARFEGALSPLAVTFD